MRPEAEEEGGACRGDADWRGGAWGERRGCVCVAVPAGGGAGSDVTDENIKMYIESS